MVVFMKCAVFSPMGARFRSIDLTDKKSKVTKTCLIHGFTLDAVNFFLFLKLDGIVDVCVTYPMHVENAQKGGGS